MFNNQLPITSYHLQVMSIENPTLAHFRHFRHFSSLLTIFPLYICRDTFTNVVSALQIELFMQNKPNFRKSQVNVTDLLKRNYKQMDTWSIRKKQSQTKPNKPKTNPILANKTPERTQFKPNLSCRSLWRSRNKHNPPVTKPRRRIHISIHSSL